MKDRTQRVIDRSLELYQSWDTLSAVASGLALVVVAVVLVVRWTL